MNRKSSPVLVATLIAACFFPKTLAAGNEFSVKVGVAAFCHGVSERTIEAELGRELDALEGVESVFSGFAYLITVECLSVSLESGSDVGVAYRYGFSSKPSIARFEEILEQHDPREAQYFRNEMEGVEAFHGSAMGFAPPQNWAAQIAQDVAAKFNSSVVSDEREDWRRAKRIEDMLQEMQ